MCSDARLHADEARRHVGEAGFDLAARQLLPQNNRALPVEANEVERVLADVDADCCNGFKAIGLACHGMLLILTAPDQRCGWLGREHGGSIPLAVMRLAERLPPTLGSYFLDRP